MNIADRIQMLRKQRGLSQEQLADEIGVSRQLVSKWENEQAVPDVERISILSEYFNTSTDYILKGIEPVKPEEQQNAKQPKNHMQWTIISVLLLICAAISTILIIWIANQIRFYNGADVVLSRGETIYKSGYQIFMESSQLSSVWMTSWIVLILSVSIFIGHFLAHKFSTAKKNDYNLNISKTGD